MPFTQPEHLAVYIKKQYNPAKDKHFNTIGMKGKQPSVEDMIVPGQLTNNKSQEEKGFKGASPRRVSPGRPYISKQARGGL